MEAEGLRNFGNSLHTDMADGQEDSLHSVAVKYSDLVFSAVLRLGVFKSLIKHITRATGR